jgi:hypothetical protein
MNLRQAIEAEGEDLDLISMEYTTIKLSATKVEFTTRCTNTSLMKLVSSLRYGCVSFSSWVMMFFPSVSCVSYLLPRDDDGRLSIFERLQWIGLSVSNENICGKLYTGIDTVDK